MFYVWDKFSGRVDRVGGIFNRRGAEDAKGFFDRMTGFLTGFTGFFKRKDAEDAKETGRMAWHVRGMSLERGRPRPLGVSMPTLPWERLPPLVAASPLRAGTPALQTARHVGGIFSHEGTKDAKENAEGFSTG